MGRYRNGEEAVRASFQYGCLPHSLALCIKLRQGTWLWFIGKGRKYALKWCVLSRHESDHAKNKVMYIQHFSCVLHLQKRFRDREFVFLETVDITAVEAGTRTARHDELPHTVLPEMHPQQHHSSV